MPGARVLCGMWLLRWAGRQHRVGAQSCPSSAALSGYGSNGDFVAPSQLVPMQAHRLLWAVLVKQQRADPSRQ